MSLKIRFKTNGGHGALLNRYNISQHSVLKGAPTARFGAKLQTGKVPGDAVGTGNGYEVGEEGGHCSGHRKGL